ncbi:MAG: alpha-mannosidase [Planctomycetota bacterium]|jgi:alpha-mannosidase
MSHSLKQASQVHTLSQNHWKERIEAQIDLADQLLKEQQSAPNGWAEAIESARGIMEAAYGSGEPLEAAVKKAETALTPMAESAKAMTVHCIGHAHIDMNWQWSWPETVAVTLDTFTTVLRLMEEYPDFTFSQSQASVYEIVQRHDPAMLGAIAARVREGRWEVTASHWVEGDKNLANAESLSRHILTTRTYMKELFDLAPEDVPVDWAPDTFGHAATVPNYLAQAGVKYCYLHRPGIDSGVPEAFRWQGTDGSEVLAYNDSVLGYNGRSTPALIPHCLRFLAHTGGTHYPFVYGIGDHGGGPTRRDLEMIQEMDAWPVFPTLRFSTAKAFFEALAAEAKSLPVHIGELNTEFAGCYTTQSLIKKVNRVSENRLYDTEFAATLATMAADREYPKERLEASWREALLTHFHDILPGSGVHDTRTYTHGMYQRVMADLSIEETQSLRTLAGRVNTAALAEQMPAGLKPAARLHSSLGGGAGVWTGDGNLSSAELVNDHGDRPFVLFNSTGAERREVVEVTLWDDAAPHESTLLADRVFLVKNEAGTAIPAQKTGRGDEWGHPYVRVAFPVVVPPFGYATYVVSEAEKDCDELKPCVRFLEKPHHCTYSQVERERFGMENECLRLELDPETGGLASLITRSDGREWIDASAPNSLLRYGVERPHEMSSWLLDHTNGWSGGGVKAIRNGVSGPYRCSLEVDLAFEESSFTLVYTLDAGTDALHVDIRGTWFQRGTATEGIPTLRLELPLALDEPKARYEIPFGGITRPHHRGEEQPGLQWVSASEEGGAGVLLCNDSKYGFGLKGSTLHATLIHASYCPDPLPEIGEHAMAFRIRPFASLTDCNAIHGARCLNHPLRVVGTGIQEGELPLVGSAVRVDGGAAISGMKRSEDGASLILRLFDTTGVGETVRLGLDPALLGERNQVEVVDLMERPIKSDAASLNGTELTVALPANGIVSLRIG